MNAITPTKNRITALLALCIAALACFALLSQDEAKAATSAIDLALSGRLVDSDGQPLNGSYDVVVRLYDHPTAGTLRYAESFTAGNANALSVNNGYYSAPLGAGTGTVIAPGTALETVLRTYDALYMTLVVGADAEMTPRIRVRAAPYAVNARTLEGSRYVKAAADPGTATAGDLLYNSTSNLLKYWDGGVWRTLATGTEFWGRAGTVLTPTNAGDIVRVADGSQGTPSISFSNDTNTGLFRSGSDQLSFTAGGTESVRIINTGILSAITGSAAAPAFAFVNDTTTGMYSSAANTLDFAAAGVRRLSISAEGVHLMTAAADPAGAANGTIYYRTADNVFRLRQNGAWVTLNIPASTGTIWQDGGSWVTTTGGEVLQLPNGSAATPAYSFSGDPDNGMYLSAANQVSFSTSGSEKVRITSAGSIQVTGSGTAADPSYSFTTTVPNGAGMYLAAANNLAFSANGVETLRLSASGVTVYNKPTAGDPGFLNGSIFYNTAHQFRVCENGAWLAMGSAASSRRFKKDIEPLTNALETVTALQGVRYHWKDGRNGNGPDIGLIAEDVAKVVPEVVEMEENGVDAVSIDYGKLNAYIIEAIKERQATINDLQTRIAAMEKRHAERAKVAAGAANPPAAPLCPESPATPGSGE